MIRFAPLLLALLVAGQAAPVAAQGNSRLTNGGVVRAAAQVDSVFIVRTTKTVTIDAGDFTAYLLARIGVEKFNDSAQFRVTADSALVRISGRLMDFPPENRKNFGMVAMMIDSATTVVAEISMPQRDSGVIRFRLERILVKDIPLPEFLLIPALASYSKNYKTLAADGREFLVAMPVEGKAVLGANTIRLFMEKK